MICKLADKNLRFFLEICYKSIEIQQFNNENITIGIPNEVQALGAKKASYSFLEEIKSSGNYGLRLHAFIERIGHIFRLAHKRPSQSENEQNHFSIISGNYTLTNEDHLFIREALKYNVLKDEKSTKAKSDNINFKDDFFINRIYSPYFNISYRKKRKLQLSSDEFKIILHGSESEFSNLISNKSKEWNVIFDDRNTMSLFNYD